VHRLAALPHQKKESHSKNGLTTIPVYEIKQALFNGAVIAADVQPKPPLDLL
jgi:hypothetical protein